MMEWYLGLNERERRFVLIGGIAAVLVLIFGVLWPLDQSVAREHARLAHKQSDLAWMRSVTPQLAAAGFMTPVSDTRSLIVVIDNSAREAGLGGALTSSEPAGPGGLRVRLDKAPFDILVGWLARLSEQHGIRVESATIDGAGPPGLVNAGVVLQTSQR